MFEQRFGIVDTTRFERLGKTAVNLLDLGLVKFGRQSFAYSIVIEFNAAIGATTAKKLCGSE